ncbi:ubiquitin carboxyl-terminal hydrolase 20 [Aplysia californica]|uniref:ubiquitinyl hydrolase 1 n=1 Tax=Aplysia californica TaxID=6500 RepID=A0ABM0JQE8_APLCA|nr:ubiquitin carboxyl-terminal hydrolase 20 [Aplysia californica]XP_035825849.1 ubiquitin carboxyl-terminal hydrolase 20 [Aplysia californica]
MAAADGSGCSTPQRSISGDESDSDFENEQNRPRGLTGLQNLGNTCYLNSAVQSLSNCPPLTQYFLDCAQLIRPEKAPMLSRSYLKLMTELWHKKRPSYVVPSGVVTGIKAVHPMFRGYTQQDAQEFLRCLMDQLHEELKVAAGSDDSDSEDEGDDGGGGGCDDDTNNGNSTAGDPVEDTARYHAEPKSSSTAPGEANRRPSFDSMSSHSELDYETCDSGLSSERSSNGERDNISSDENNSDSNETCKLRRSDRMRKASAGGSVAAVENADSVANTKEMKETANLLEKKNEAETQARRPRGKAVMEGGDSREQGSPPMPFSGVPTKDGEMQTVSVAAQREQYPVLTLQQQQQSMPKSPLKKQSKTRKASNIKYDSIISQTFDGKILSSVRCLNCETVSTTKETFQDLSLPIPSKDHLHMLHSGHHQVTGGVTPPKGGACGEVHQGWLAWMYSWMKSWFIGPTITLQDCLSAFFSADELKGDNMYSCEKCKKLRNGLKYSKVLELPEILSIHLKRFRHEFYSSKISTYISFPLEGLDMEPYLHKACKNEVTLYDLVAIICHHGTAGGGHYTAYCLNHLNEQWYEFDDQYVTEVDVSQVQNCEAYVLFYRKSNKKIESVRQRIMELESSEVSILRFYLSKQWVSKFHTFAEPGPITNSDFLCKHGGVPPGKVSLIDDLVVEIHQSTWELLHNRFGGGPVCNHLYACKTCHSELEKLRQRQRMEKESFIQLNEEFQEEEHTAAVYAISMAWFKEWEAFVREKTDAPPGPVENSRIIVYKNGQATLRATSDHGQLSRDMWLFLHRIYGGGPELIIRQSAGASVKPSSSSPPAPVQQQQQQQQTSPPHSTGVIGGSSQTTAPQTGVSPAASSSPSPSGGTVSSGSSVTVSPVVSAATTSHHPVPPVPVSQASVVSDNLVMATAPSAASCSMPSSSPPAAQVVQKSAKRREDPTMQSQSSAVSTVSPRRNPAPTTTAPPYSTSNMGEETVDKTLQSTVTSACDTLTSESQFTSGAGHGEVESCAGEQEVMMGTGTCCPGVSKSVNSAGSVPRDESQGDEGQAGQRMMSSITGDTPSSCSNSSMSVMVDSFGVTEEPKNGSLSASEANNDFDPIPEPLTPGNTSAPLWANKEGTLTASEASLADSGLGGDVTSSSTRNDPCLGEQRGHDSCAWETALEVDSNHGQYLPGIQGEEEVATSRSDNDMGSSAQNKGRAEVKPSSAPPAVGQQPGKGKGQRKNKKGKNMDVSRI